MFTTERPILLIFLRLAVLLTIKDTNQDDALTFMRLINDLLASSRACDTFVFSHREFATTVSTATQLHTLPDTLLAPLRWSPKGSFKAFIFLFSLEVAAVVTWLFFTV